jgi:hypothetical protein
MIPRFIKNPKTIYILLFVIVTLSSPWIFRHFEQVSEISLWPPGIKLRPPELREPFKRISAAGAGNAVGSNAAVNQNMVNSPGSIQVSGDVNIGSKKAVFSEPEVQEILGNDGEYVMTVRFLLRGSVPLGPYSFHLHLKKPFVRWTCSGWTVAINRRERIGPEDLFFSVDSPQPNGPVEFIIYSKEANQLVYKEFHPNSGDL